MKPINYKSDFDVILHLETCVQNDDGTVERKDVGFPDHDFVATFWTASKVNTFVASCINGVMTNCFNDNGKIHVVFDNHKLSKGQLKVELHTSLPNGIYPDGTQDIYEPHPLDIELVDGVGECPSRIEVEASVAVVYRSAYEDAVAAGYVGTQQEYAQLVAQLPQSVETAQSVAQSAVSLETSSAKISDEAQRISDLTARSEATSTALADTAKRMETVAATAAEEVGHVNLLLADLAKSKLEIWAALRDRGFDIPSSASSQEMAELIRQIEYGEGVLSKIGYESTDDYKWLMAQIDQAYMYKLMYEKGEIDTLKDCGAFAPKVTVRDGNADFLFADKNNTGNSNKLLTYVPKILNVASAKSMFRHCENLVYAPPMEFRSLTDASYMFFQCTALASVDGLDTSNVINASWMFSGCKALTSVDGLDFGNVTNAQSMFYQCIALASVDGLDMGNVTNAQGMFSGCTALASVDGLDTSSVTTASWMFSACIALTSVDGLDFGSNANGDGIFINCRNLAVIRLLNLGKSSSNWVFNTNEKWGTTDEEARQSVIYTLLTNSYDRAANGLSAATIKLHANTKAVLTEEEIAAITAKGYTIA